MTKKAIFFIFGLILFVSCGRRPDVVLSELGSETVTYEELIRMNNCGGKADSEQTATKSFSTSIEGEAKIQGGYEEYIQGSISAKYGQYRGTTKSIKFIAPPNTNMEFLVVWSEDERAGNVIVDDKQATYSVRIPLSVELKSNLDKGCPISVGSEPTLPVLNTPNATLASEKIDSQKGRILITTGSLWDQPHFIDIVDENGIKLTTFNSIGNVRDDTGARFSPDGRKIVYTAPAADGLSYIFKSNSDGSEIQKLALSHEWASPDWSPNGAFIAYTCPNLGICIMDNNGTNIKQISFGHDAYPRWSHSGKKILYHSSPGDGFEVYLMNADGSGQTNLTNNDKINDWLPAWSPDDTQIAFTRWSEAYQDSIWIMNADGSNPIKITGEEHNEFPIWSPDGIRILFRSSRDSDRNRIFTMNVDGSNVLLLVDTDGAPSDWYR